MSEPVSNARVEHVLASIRRLISQNDRRNRAHHEPTGGEAVRSRIGEGPQSGETLLLTPSLRVTEPESAGGAGQPSEVSFGPVQPHASPAAPPAAVHTITLDAATHDRTSVLRLDESVRLREVAADPPAAAHDGPSSQVQSMNLDRQPAPADPAAASEAMDFEAEPVGETPRARDRRPSRTPTDGALEAKIAALEAAIARTEGDWEPDGVAHDAYSGTTSPAIDWNKPAQSAQKPAPYRLEHAARRDVPKTREVAAGPGASLADIVDEDMLREIVADIVRQELQGVLGDRITRNVRKLVRREILRALESRDID